MTKARDWNSNKKLLLLGSLILILLKGGLSQESATSQSRQGNQPEELTSQYFLFEELLLHQPEWFTGAEARQIADNILLYQRDSGGWPKNIDYRRSLSESEKRNLFKNPDLPLATIDNGATYTQLRFLAKIIRATNDQNYVLSFFKGFEYLLIAQYANGGWPQFYPLQKGYYAHITFNDDAMIGVLRLLRDVAVGKPDFEFVDQARRDRARKAVRKGIECILKTQIVVDGQLTAWCAQYDEKTLKPAQGRSYELISLSGSETVRIIQFLMEIDNPSPEIINAIQAAVSWLDKVKIEGIRVVRKPDPKSPTGFDKIVVADSTAPPVWARFYQIDNNQLFFSDRDGKVYYDLAEISSERRNEYGWLGYWPQELLTESYPQWQKRWAPDNNVLRR